jgi:hypothetical protein
MKVKVLSSYLQAIAVSLLIQFLAVPVSTASSSNKAKYGIFVVDAQGQEVGHLLRIEGTTDPTISGQVTQFFAVINVDGRLASIDVSEDRIFGGNFLGLPDKGIVVEGAWLPFLLYSEPDCVGSPWLVPTRAMNIEQTIVIDGVAYLAEDPSSNEVLTVFLRVRLEAAALIFPNHFPPMRPNVRFLSWIAAGTHYLFR